MAATSGSGSAALLIAGGSSACTAADSGEGSVVTAKRGKRGSIRVDCAAIAANLAVARAGPGKRRVTMVKTSTSSSTSDFDSQCEGEAAVPVARAKSGGLVRDNNAAAPVATSYPRVSIVHRTMPLHASSQRPSAGRRMTLKRSKSAPRRCKGGNSFLKAVFVFSCCLCLYCAPLCEDCLDVSCLGRILPPIHAVLAACHCVFGLCASPLLVC